MTIQKIISITKAENIGAEEVVIVAVKDHDQEKGLLKIVVKIENVNETMALIMDVTEITETIMIEIIFGKEKENETVIEIVIVFETMIGTVIATEIGIEIEVGIDMTENEIDAIDI